MLRSIPIPLIALVGLILAVDGIVAWLADAALWGWGLPWVIGTGILVGTLAARLGQKSLNAAVIGAAAVVLLGVMLFVKGDAIGSVALDDVLSIVIFLLIFVGEITIGIASVLRGRASAEGANFWVYVIAGLALVILANYVVNRHFKQTWDVTESRLESLSDQTLAKLSRLDNDVHVIGFFRDSDPERTAYSDMLKKYESAANGRFTFEFVDPDKYPDIAQREQINPRDISVVVTCEGRREVVTGGEEKDLTSAVIKVTKPGRKNIYFSSYHGEKGVETDLLTLSQMLKDLNFGVRTHRLVDGDIPVDCDVFVIPGPTSTFLPIEVERLEKYLTLGKSLLAMLDPDSVALGLEDLLARYGVIVEPNLIVERQRGLVPYAGGFYMGEQQSQYARTFRYGEHAVVEDLSLRRIPTGFFRAREIRAGWSDSTMTADAKTIVSAGSDMAVAATDVRNLLMNPREAVSAEGLKAGPFSVGVALTAEPHIHTTPEETKTRIVAFGDADFATDQGVRREPGNASLISNAITWLSEDEDLISIQPREPGDKPVHLTANETTFMFLFSVWRFPALIFVAGVLIWWYRRSRGPSTDKL